MRKFRTLACFLLVLTLCCSICGCSNSLNYKEDRIGGISYEIPNKFDDNFSATQKQGFDEELQEFYLETDIFNVLRGVCPNLRKSGNTTYGKYTVYKYVGSITVAGKQTSVDVAAIGYNNSIYTFSFIWSDNFASQREEIYTHFLESLR